MSSVVLWSLSLLATPVPAGAPFTASVRAADDEPRPQRRSREDDVGPRGLQMGVGPTALALAALSMALVGRSLRRRRGAPRPIV